MSRHGVLRGTFAYTGMGIVPVSFQIEILSTIFRVIFFRRRS
jgi:hypothetical protein